MTSLRFGSSPPTPNQGNRPSVSNWSRHSPSCSWVGPSLAGGVTEIPTEEVPESDAPRSAVGASAPGRSGAARTNPDDSAQYWTQTYDEPLGPDDPLGHDEASEFEAASSSTSSAPHAPYGAQADRFEPGRPQGKRERDTLRQDRAPTITPHRQTIRPSSPAPQVRSVTEALGSTRRYIDAALMAGFGILCFVVAGASTADQPAVMILVGCLAIGYSGYIALSVGGYVMPYFIYALAIVGGAIFMFK